MINSIHEAFPRIVDNNCIDILSECQFEIIDEENGRCIIVTENGQFKVSNIREKEIIFLAVDSCIFDSSDGSRSDCILWDEATFIFIELKHCKNKNISQNRSKAKKQLIATIETFTSILTIEKTLEAYICITCNNNSEFITMTPRAANMDAVSEFDELYNTSLYYSCDKEFI